MISDMVHRLIVASRSLWTTKSPWKWRGYVTWPVFNFCGPIHMLAMAKATAVKF